MVSLLYVYRSCHHAIPNNMPLYRCCKACGAMNAFGLRESRKLGSSPDFNEGVKRTGEPCRPDQGHSNNSRVESSPPLQEQSNNKKISVASNRGEARGAGRRTGARVLRQSSRGPAYSLDIGEDVNTQVIDTGNKCSVRHSNLLSR